MRRLAVLALAAASTACAGADTISEVSQDVIAAPGVAYTAARRAAAPPQFTPVQSPAPLTGGAQQSVPQPQPVAYPPSQPNSMWREGRRSFFNDQRASQ